MIGKSKISLDETLFNEACNETVVYYCAPVSLISLEKYPDAISSEICVTFEGEEIPDKACACEVTISPTRMIEQFTLEDYDWEFFDISQEVFEELRKLWIERKSK